jgi:hypothetical protein
MDHPCYKCGHSIEDGKAFCPECGAPQIRVTISEVSPEHAPAADGGVPALTHAMEPGSLRIPVSFPPLSGAHPLQTCALAAAVSFGLTLLGLNPFVAALGTGFLAVAFTRRRSPGTLIRGGAGARLGALSGLMFFAISTTLNTLAIAALHKGAEIRSEQLDRFQQWATRYPGPGVQPFLDFVKSPNGFAIMMAASLVVGFVAFVVLGGCGGALAATILGRRDRS